MSHFLLRDTHLPINRTQERWLDSLAKQFYTTRPVIVRYILDAVRLNKHSLAIVLEAPPAPRQPSETP